MRKRLISVCIVVILIHSICGCAQTVENAPITAAVAVEESYTETVEAKYTEIENDEETDAVDTESESEETAISKEEYSGSEEPAESIYIIQPQLTLNDTHEMQDWQEAYVEYAEELEAEYQDKGWSDITYSLIYVDEDDIPELVIDAGFSIYHILTFHDGAIDELKTDRATARYMERQNLLDDDNGAMGFYHDYIYSIKNGKWVYVTGGEYSDKYDDEHGAYGFTYRWEGEEVPEAVYEQKLKKVFDTEHAIEPENFVSFEEMLSLFQM